MVCQARVAHFTRMGNLRTPPRAASLPSSGPMGASVVSTSWKLLKIFSASGYVVLPFRRSVIREAEALKIWQPSPTKLTSRITPSSTLR